MPRDDTNFYQLLSPLSDEEYTALKEDVRERGILVPVELDEDGNVLDGHHRMQVALELEQETGRKVPYQVIVRAGLTEEGKFFHALSLNLQRRQLTMEQKYHLGVELRRRFRWSSRKLATLLAVNQSTIARWLQDRPDLPDAIEGADGRVHPSSKWGGIYADRSQAMQALDAAAALGSLDRAVPIKRALVLAREARLEAPWTVSEEPLPGPVQVELRVGTLRQALSDLEPGSVDLILTDPPYPEEFLPVWTELGEVAFNLLREGAPLVAYSGHFHLQEVMNRLSETGLEYRWIGALNFVSHTPQYHNYRVNCSWRPILFYSKGPWKPPRWWQDSWVGGGMEKELHVWQQSVDTFFDLVERFTDQGQLVVDPFLGSGTTGVAAVRLGRRFIGCDIDPGAVRVSRERLLQEVT